MVATSSHRKTFFAHAKDDNIRSSASSGGFCKAFLCYLLDNKIVDYVIITRIKDNSTDPETIITDNKEKILTRTNSVYEYNNQIKVLKDIDKDKKYCFVGLPCFVKYVKQQQAIGKYNNITITIGLLCDQAPSSSFKKQILKDYGIDFRSASGINYRHGEHPGVVNVQTKDGKNHSLFKYEQAWSKYNMTNCFTPSCCRQCELFGAKEADISAGDAWHTKYAKSKKGWTKITVNNSVLKLVEDAENKNYLTVVHSNPLEKMENITLGPTPKHKKQKPSVLIHTFHYANNYGAILQAYALQEYLVKHDRKVQFLNWWNNSKNTVENNQKFLDFHNEFIHTTHRYMSYQELLDNPPNDFDFYISGSDQIFNTENGWFDKTFAHHYIDSPNKITYAASFGINEIHETVIDDFVHEIKKFKKVSTREYEGINLLNGIGIDSVLCVDPVLLHEKEFWLDFASKSNDVDKPDKYSLIYSPYGTNQKFKQELDESNIICIDQNSNFSPIDFVYLFANADKIITDSYHGRLFGFILDKPTLFIKNNNATRNSRFDTLDKILGDNKLLADLVDRSKMFLISNTSLRNKTI